MPVVFVGDRRMGIVAFAHKLGKSVWVSPYLIP
jgi:hypothetical protein